MAGLIHKELSYKINGLCFEVQNKLGTKFQEKHYLRALCALLKRESISYQTEVLINIDFDGEKLGTMRADLVIDDKILIELKAVDYLTTDHKKTNYQIFRFVKT